MTSIPSVGFLAGQLSTVRTLTSQSDSISRLSEQLNTGKKSSNLQAFGIETQRLLDLRTDHVQRKAHVTSIETAKPRIKAADLVLERLQGIAGDLTSSSQLPINPGPVRVSRVHDEDSDKMQVTVDPSRSRFLQATEFRVTAVPSSTGTNGTYDITVSDGLGGRTQQTINLSEVPPGDGYNHTFTLSGGPGDGAQVNLTLDNLSSASTSTFSVRWPETETTRSLLNGYLEEVQNLLNERVGDRYLFSGSRYSTEPVRDLSTAHKQVTKVTIDGVLGRADDIFTVNINGHSFPYKTTGLESTDEDGLQEIARQLQLDIEAQKDAFEAALNAAEASGDTRAIQVAQRDVDELDVLVGSKDGILTFTGTKLGQTFEVETSVTNAPDLDNEADVTTTQDADTTQPQIDSIDFTGATVDIGDTFKVKIHIGDPDDPYNEKFRLNNPDATEEPPLFREFEVAYTVTPEDFQTGTVTTPDDVVDKLATALGTVTDLPVTVTAPPPAGSTLELTGNDNDEPFTTTVEVIDGDRPNSMTVATLPPEAMPADIRTDPTEDPDLPFYDAEYETEIRNSKAFEKAKVTAEESLSVTYGITSNDPAFQKLVAALRQVRSALDNPGAYEQLISQARVMLADARADLSGLQSDNAAALGTLEQSLQRHADANANLEKQIADIEGIDQTEVAARLNTSINSRDTTIRVLGRVTQLSLLDVLA